jgi:hypothetical protein
MKNIYLTLIIAIIAGITLTGGGCDETGTGSGTGTTTDPDVLIFNNLVVQENNGNGSSPNAINLLIGRIDSSASDNKDVVLVDLAGNGTDFYFRSGDLSFLDNISPGYQTQWGQFIEWENITQAQWDTLSRVWKSSANADTISPVDFQGVDTRYPGSQYFGFPLTSNRVFAFYLKGKYDNGITPNRVYGMIYLDAAQNVGGQFPYRLTVDVKLNIGGRNQFLKEVPVQ